MQLVDGKLIVSATDLVGFMQCEHLTWLERLAARGDLERPTSDHPMLQLLQEQGNAHEQEYLERLRAAGLDVLDQGPIGPPASGAYAPEDDPLERITRRAAATRKAMESGVQVIYQAGLLDDSTDPMVRGYADFLRRVETPSDLGHWSYEPEDTKLSSHVSAWAVLQLCVYAAEIARIQGRCPTPSARYPDRSHGQRAGGAMATITGNSATTERDRTSGDISLVRGAIARFTDTDVHRATRQLSHRELDRLSTSLVLPKRALTEGAGVSRLLRNRVAARRDTWARRIACDLSSGSLRRIVEALGPNHADPSFDELAMAVESLLGELGGTVIGLVLAMAVDQGFQAAPHCRHLLRTDPRLTPSAPTDDGACDRAPIRSDEDRAVDRQEVLEARRARKRASKLRRAPRARRERRPRRYRRAKHAPVPTHTAPDSVVTPQGSAASSTLAPTRRPVRSVVFDDGASYADPLVGSVIWSTIRFTGGRRGSKRRPCVVIAASGRRHLVVRPCYSEGGLQTRRWKSVEVLDLSAAGLDRRSWVAPEEHRVPRRDARRIAGRLATGDWNML